MRKALSLAMVLLMATAPIPVLAQAVDADVQKGIAQVDDGDYDGAILTLDNASRRLLADKTKVSDIAQAYLYLGVAYIGKGREAVAKAKFREAISQIKDLSLSADRFSPKVVDLFEAAKAEEARAVAARPTVPAASGAVPVPASEKKKGGGGKPILIVGGLAAAGGIAAVAAGGGSSGSATTPPTTDSRSRLQFSGAVPTGGNDYECYQVVATKAGNLEATLTWTNGQIALSVICSDLSNYTDVCSGAFNRTSNTSGTYTAAVTQRSYSICAYNSSGTRDTYNLTVLFP